MGGTSGRRGGARIKGPGAARENPGLRAIGVAVSKVALPIVAHRGGGILVRLKSEWVAIAGRDWAEVSWPTALGRDGVLKLRAIPGAAIELQHRAPLLIERINQFFGRCVISRLALVQGPLPLLPRPSRPSLRPLSEGEAKALDRQLSGIADPDLRAALTRLGRAVNAQQH
ncbi:MAG: DUF721 domain-containing protein [Alphaproteobacteria bacterium]|nr:DUF721 domain-containing protein [Alphaproteobacteria bacterium]